MSECFTANIVKQSQRETGFCACGHKARPGQRNCRECHKRANSVYRARLKTRREEALAIARRSGIQRLVSLLEGQLQRDESDDRDDST